MQEAHRASNRVYGYRKVHLDVVEIHEQPCCPETVRKIMQDKGLSATRKKRFVVTTESGHGLPVAANLLARDFEPQGPNQKWVADITYIATQEGWLYLAAVMDLFGRRIAGWATSSAIDATLVIDALTMALRRRCPGPELLHHSDRGSQYASAAFRELLDLHGVTASMSRKGNCWDNACMERFFGRVRSVYRLRCTDCDCAATMESLRGVATLVRGAPNWPVGSAARLGDVERHDGQRVAIGTAGGEQR